MSPAGAVARSHLDVRRRTGVQLYCRQHRAPDRRRCSQSHRRTEAPPRGAHRRVYEHAVAHDADHGMIRIHVLVGALVALAALFLAPVPALASPIEPMLERSVASSPSSPAAGCSSQVGWRINNTNFTDPDGVRGALSATDCCRQCTAYIPTKARPNGYTPSLPRSSLSLSPPLAVCVRVRVRVHVRACACVCMCLCAS